MLQSPDLCRWHLSRSTYLAIVKGRLAEAALVGGLVYRPLPVDDPKQRRPDITRARTLLGWEPTIDLEEGLLKTVDYFKNKLDG